MTSWKERCPQPKQACTLNLPLSLAETRIRVLLHASNPLHTTFPFTLGNAHTSTQSMRSISGGECYNITLSGMPKSDRHVSEARGYSSSFLYCQDIRRDTHAPTYARKGHATITGLTQLSVSAASFATSASPRYISSQLENTTSAEPGATSSSSASPAWKRTFFLQANAMFCAPNHWQ